jgi:DNA adenine methylase
MAEPYAGGAGASLELLFSEHVCSIFINDLDYRIFSFWWAALNRTDEFIDKIQTVQLSIREWKLQREIYRNARKYKRFEVGFATFYLNRTNRSGILFNGGPIGGVKQKGKWLIDARFNRHALSVRVERIAAYKERIAISNLDALAFLEKLRSDSLASPLFIYLDPPYYDKGSELYLSTYDHFDHSNLASFLQSCKHNHWVATYDDVPAIRKMYSACRLTSFTLRYSAHTRRDGAEHFIAPRSLAVPRQALKSMYR